MHFPVANIELNPAIPFLIGLAVSVFSSPAGISGGFLILPICVNFLNFSSIAVSPTNYIFNIVAMPSGLWRLAREKRLLWGLGCLLALGSLPGITVGMILRNTWFKDAGDFKTFVALVLAALALNLARSIRQIDLTCARAEKAFLDSKKDQAAATAPTTGSCVHGRFSFIFGGEKFSVSIWALMAVSLLVGLAGGIYGIGGAAIIAPVLISHFRLPIYVVNGAALFAGWIAAGFGLVSYILLWPIISGQAPVYPDWKLGLLLGVGGLVGVYTGSRAQRYIAPKPLKILMLLLIAGMALQSFGLF